MRYTKFCIILSLIALLSACATPSRKILNSTTYDRLSINTATVTFYEDRPTDWESLETDLLYSCAQVTTIYGYDYFIIIGGDLSSTPLLYGTNAKIPLYKGTVYSSTTTIISSQTEDKIQDGQMQATAIIQMYKKPRPPRLWYAYDARELMDNLRPPG